MRKLPYKTILMSLLAVTWVAACAAQSSGQQFLGQQDSLGRKKVAVVLSGGGAKGVAHVGALRVIEQAGIPVDIVVGTSMGAIIGGLYSIGYTPDQLEKMIMSQDWGLLMSDQTERHRKPFSQKERDEKYQVSFPFGRRFEAAGGLIEGTNLDMLFSDLLVGYHDTISFRELPIHFACVATDIVDGTPVVFHDGVLPVAMRASMAIPGVFTPVDIDGMVLVDGGLVNNYPADIAREMGADVIIGVDVQSPLRGKEELVGATAILGQIIELAMQQQTFRRNVRMTDVYVRVDVEGYSTASFNLPALDSLIRRGTLSTLERWADLRALKAEIGVPEEFSPPPHGPYQPLSERGEFHVYDISFDGLNPRERLWVMRKCRIRENQQMNPAMLARCMSMLGATTSHANIYYTLKDTLDGYNLTFHMDAVKGNALSVGVSFDSEEIASVLVNGTFRLGRSVPMAASVTGRLGKRMMLKGDYSLMTSPLSHFKLDYTFNFNDVALHSGGKRYLNPTYIRHFVGLSFINMNFVRQNLRMELGTAFEHYDYRSWLSDYRDFEENRDPLDIDSERLLSYFARLDYETIDSRYFTTSGTEVSLAYDLYTDNFYQYKGENPFSAISASWMTAFPISHRFSLITSAYGRVLSGVNIPFPMLNTVGGKFFGRYAVGQLPFEGIGFMEIAPSAFLAAAVRAQQHIGRRHYVSASFNYGLAYDDIFNLVYGKSYFGAALDYGYDLRSFPIKVSLGWSNITRRLGLYFQAGYVF